MVICVAHGEAIQMATVRNFPTDSWLGRVRFDKNVTCYHNCVNVLADLDDPIASNRFFCPKTSFGAKQKLDFHATLDGLFNFLFTLPLSVSCPIPIVDIKQPNNPVYDRSLIVLGFGGFVDLI
jgi:hypothetical protein